jgi:hypothetical protein
MPQRLLFVEFINGDDIVVTLQCGNKNSVPSESVNEALAVSP